MRGRKKSKSSLVHTLDLTTERMKMPFAAVGKNCMEQAWGKDCEWRLTMLSSRCLLEIQGRAVEGAVILLQIEEEMPETYVWA